MQGEIKRKIISPSHTALVACRIKTAKQLYEEELKTGKYRVSRIRLQVK